MDECEYIDSDYLCPPGTGLVSEHMAVYREKSANWPLRERALRTRHVVEVSIEAGRSLMGLRS